MYLIMAAYSIKDLQEWAARMGGKCLSEVYENNKTKYTWSCGLCEHVWEATWGNVYNHYSWCPECASSLREVVVRHAFEENFPGCRFTKDRETIGMEIDGYCPELCLGFEHDGIHHAQRVPHFQRSEGDFESQQARDLRKDELCGELGITLIRVPGRHKLPIKGIRQYVREQIDDLLCAGRIPCEQLMPDADFFAGVQAARGKKRNAEYIKKIQAKLPHGHTLVSSECPSRTWPLQVKCVSGHVYQTCYDNIARGRGCPTCRPNAPKSLADLEAIARPRGYRIIREWVDNAGTRPRRMIEVQCANADHPPYQLMWDNFKAGKGCEKCGFARRGATKRNTAEEVTARLNRLGVSISGTYLGNNKNTVFVCNSAGHRYTSTLAKQEMSGPNKACPVCVIESLRGRESIELAEPYTQDTDPVRTKLNWRCLKCGGMSQTTYRGMLIRKKKCGSAKCRT